MSETFQPGDHVQWIFKGKPTPGFWRVIKVNSNGSLTVTNPSTHAGRAHLPAAQCVKVDQP